MTRNGTPRGSTEARPDRPGGNTRCRKTERNDMLRRLGIRAKVMAVLAVPMLVIFGTGAFISYGAITDFRYATAADHVVEVLVAYAPLGGAVETERIVTLNGGTPEQIAAARKATDAALASVKPLTASLDLSRFPAAVVKQFRDVQNAHNTLLPSVRTLADIGSARALLQRNYAQIIQGQISLVEQVSNSFKNRELASYITAYSEISNTSDNLVVELIDGIGVLMSQGANPSIVRAYGSQAASTELARTQARLTLSGLGVGALAMPAKDPTSNFTRMRALLVEGDPATFGQ